MDIDEQRKFNKAFNNTIEYFKKEANYKKTEIHIFKFMHKFNEFNQSRFNAIEMGVHILQYMIESFRDKDYCYVEFRPSDCIVTINYDPLWK